MVPTPVPTMGTRPPRYGWPRTLVQLYYYSSRFTFSRSILTGAFSSKKILVRHFRTLATHVACHETSVTQFLLVQNKIDRRTRKSLPRPDCLAHSTHGAGIQAGCAAQPATAHHDASSGHRRQRRRERSRLGRRGCRSRADQRRNGGALAAGKRARQGFARAIGGGAGDGPAAGQWRWRECSQVPRPRCCPL
jgi:hypothetical protein